MNITTEPELPAGPPLPGKRPLPNLLVQGFSLARRSWPFVACAYAVNLVFGLLASVPFANGIAPYLDHSLAAQRIAGTLDLTYLMELALHLRATPFFPMAVHTSGWLNLLQLLILFFLFAGTVSVYMSAEPPQLPLLLRGGVTYFWRFVRASILVGCVAALMLGVLLAIRSALLARLGETYFGETLFVYAAVSGAVIFLAGLIFRLWGDLVQAYVVRNAVNGELRAHRALLPAGKLLLRHFARIFGSFLLAGLAGAVALGFCLLLWKALPPGQVWAAALLAQIGLFCLLASRFWQRGLEAAFVLAVDPPAVPPFEAVEVVEENALSLAGVAGQGGLSEPTLFELVQKLRTQPWATPPEAPARLTPAAPPATTEAKPAPASVLAEDATALDPKENQTASVEEEPSPSPMDRHAAKFPLGGAPAATEQPAVAPEKPNAGEPPN